MEESPNKNKETLLNTILDCYNLPPYETLQAPLPEITKRFPFFKSSRCLDEQNFDKKTFDSFILELKAYLFRGLLETYGKDKEVYDIVKLLNQDWNYKNTDICFRITQEMTEHFTKEQARDLCIKNIRKFISENLGEQNFEILTNPNNQGANDSFLVKFDNNEKFYIKTFSRTLVPNQKETRIDVKEMFLYKLLENVSIGPETQFFLNEYSSNSGKISCGNYIMTRDITAILKDETITERLFYEDGDKKSFPIYDGAFKDRNFLIKFFTITSLSSIFCITDALGVNFYNYGILKTIANQIVDYDLKIIDHLPICSNGNISDYSPGRFLLSKFFNKSMIPRHQFCFSCLRNIIEMQVKKNNNFSSIQLGLDAEVIKLIESKKIIQAIITSEVQVLDLVKKFPNVFLIEKIKGINENDQEISTPALLKMFTRKILNNYYNFFNEYGTKNLKKKHMLLEKCKITILLEKQIQQEKGEVIKIVGNIVELGCWDYKKGLNMLWDGLEKTWKVETWISINMTFEWKFALYNMITNEVQWESGNNRITHIDKNWIYKETWRN